MIGSYRREGRVEGSSCERKKRLAVKTLEKYLSGLVKDDPL